MPIRRTVSWRIKRAPSRNMDMVSTVGSGNCLRSIRHPTPLRKPINHSLENCVSSFCIEGHRQRDVLPLVANMERFACQISSMMDHTWLRPKRLLLRQAASEIGRRGKSATIRERLMRRRFSRVLRAQQDVTPSDIGLHGAFAAAGSRALRLSINLKC